MNDFSKQWPEQEWGGLSRRRFLKGALLSAGALGTGAAVSGCSTDAGSGADGKPLLFLNTHEVATLTALGEAIIPTQKGFPSLAQAEVIARLDEELSFVGDAIQSDMHAAISVLEFAPIVYRHFGRYSRLDVTARREILSKMMASRSEILRAVSTNMKVLIHFMYFGHRSSWDAIGYDGTFSQLPPIASVQRQHYATHTGRATS